MGNKIQEKIKFIDYENTEFDTTEYIDDIKKIFKPK